MSCPRRAIDASCVSSSPEPGGRLASVRTTPEIAAAWGGNNAPSMIRSMTHHCSASGSRAWIAAGSAIGAVSSLDSNSSVFAEIAGRGFARRLPDAVFESRPAVDSGRPCSRRQRRWLATGHFDHGQLHGLPRVVGAPQGDALSMDRASNSLHVSEERALSRRRAKGDGCCRAGETFTQATLVPAPSRMLPANNSRRNPQ